MERRPRGWFLSVLGVVLGLLVAVACTGPARVTISVVPSAVTLARGASQVFTATVVGAEVTSVTWSTTGGELVPSGLSAVFTAPLVAGEYVVTATSVADPLRSARATVTVTGGDGESLTAPSGVSLGRVEDGVLLRWRFDQIAAGLVFEVQRAVGDGAFEDLVVVPAAERVYLDESVSSGVLHSYRVRARSVAAVSGFSSVVAHREEVVSVPSDGYAFVGVGDDGVGVAVSGLTLVSDGLVAVSAFAEPVAPVDRPVIAPVVRLVVRVADLDLDADEPLWVMLPPLEGFDFGSDDAVWALVRVTGASGVVVEFSAVYSMNYAPVAVEMGMLRAVQVWEGLPEWVEIEVIPLLTPAPGADVSSLAEVGATPAPVFAHLSGLHRLDGSAQRESMARQCDGVRVPTHSFSAVRTAFGATSVGSQPQQAWTTEVGKRPLVLIHGIQSFAQAEADIAGESAVFAAALCTWQDFILAFQGDPRLSERFTLYVFGYDSVMKRVRDNGRVLQGELSGAFGGGDVFVVAHSMGGMVTRDAMTRGANVAQLYSLGTPYRGSAGVECILKHPTEPVCAQVTNTITYDWVLDLSRHTRPAVHMLQYPGVKDTAFEDAFKTHDHVCDRCRDVFGRQVCVPSKCRSDNIANPYLAGLPEPTPGAAFTSFVGNTLTGTGSAAAADDDLGGYDKNSARMSWAIGRFLGRFNDNIVSVGSAAFLNLHSELNLSYSDLGTLSDRSPFGSVVLAPCFDHSMLTTLKELRLPPTGTSCASAARFPGGTMTVFGWTADDILRFDTTVSIAPSSATISVNGTQQFTATVVGSANTSVSWSATCGVLSGSGGTRTYTAPAVAGSCSVTATSVADASKSATASVTVTGASGFVPAPSYISISNVSLAAASGGSRRIGFDIGWDESWRGPSRPSWVAASNNWDAAWVFVKVRVSGGAWQHATLAGSGHVQPSGSVVSVPGDRRGAFVYRSSSGYGSFAASGVGLQWDYVADGVAAGASVEVRPFAIEMVYVPQGSFSLGSGGAGTGEFRAGGTSSTPFVVGSQSSISLGDAAGRLMWTVDTYSGSPSGSTSANFPTGYGAFYVMKRELMQGQYVNFLNTLSQAQADARKHTGSSYRYAISGGSVGTYTTSLPFVALNYVSWADGTAFADWAGLRPLTELEFEKAARGPLSPAAHEFAWGSTSITQAAGLSSAGTVAETPTPASANAAYGNAWGVQGPVRAGSFAKPGDSRRDAGAGYYGALELSGNLWERAVTVGNAEGRAFAGTHGDGTLTAGGNANVSTWPGTTAAGVGFRGGDWVNGDILLAVSGRFLAAYTLANRFDVSGWRGARSAP